MNEKELRDRGDLVSEMVDRRERETDATAVLVIERTDVWKKVILVGLVGGAIGLVIGTVFGAFLGAVFKWWFS